MALNLKYHTVTLSISNSQGTNNLFRDREVREFLLKKQVGLTKTY